MKKKTAAYLISSIFLLFSILIGIRVGAVSIPIKEIWVALTSLMDGQSKAGTDETTLVIIAMVRLPRVVMMLLAGSALGGSGAAFQGLFRNPLADPYLIGVASGAGLGAVAGMTIQWANAGSGLFLVPAAAFLGAMVTVWLVYSLSRVGNVVPITTLLLAGVAISSFCSALTSFIMLRSTDSIHRAISYLFGGAPLMGWPPVIASLPYLVIGIILLLLSGHKLNVMQFGEEQAQQMGIDVEKAKLTILVSASLATAAAVAFGGVIGFIGLIVPHIVRILWGNNYKLLIPLSVLWGASALILTDAVARVIIAPSSLPVGIITAIAGAPFFLWVLRQAKTKVFW